MDKIRLMNLLHRIIHEGVASDMSFKGDIEGTKYYLQDFLSITREDVDKAFDFLIKNARTEIWKVIKYRQAFCQNTIEIKDLHRFPDMELGNVRIMIQEIIKAC